MKQEDPSLSTFVGHVKQENPQQLPPNIPGGPHLPWWQPSPTGGPVASVPNPHLPLILHSSEPAELPPLPAFLGSVVIPPPLSMEQNVHKICRLIRRRKTLRIQNEILDFWIVRMKKSSKMLDLAVVKRLINQQNISSKTTVARRRRRKFQFF